jgi:Arc/MetJ family transcription regulator
VTKRLVDIDDELLEQARLQLATKTMENTVNAALAEPSRQHVAAR